MFLSESMVLIIMHESLTDTVSLFGYTGGDSGEGAGQITNSQLEEETIVFLL